MNPSVFAQFRIGSRTRRLAMLIFLAAACSARAQQGYIGAGIDFMDPMSSAKFGIPTGSPFVRDVVPGGSAEKSGLHSGDLIRSVDGVPMSTPAQVIAAIGAHKPGDQACIAIIHPIPSQNLSIEIMVSIGSAPANGGAAPNDGWQAPSQRGNTPPQNGNAALNGSAAPAARPITAAQQAQRVQQGPCSAVLPAGWQFMPDQHGQTADVFGPKGAHAAWGIVAINPALQQDYGDIFGPPDTHAAAITSKLTQAQAQFVSWQNIAGFYTAHEFKAGPNAGIVLYHVYPADMGQYIISEYFAWAPQTDPALLSQAEAIMTSLQCTSSVRPQQLAQYVPHSGVPDPKSGGLAEGDSLKDYNSTIGTQYAHDGAGNNYLLDRASQWSDTGPDGPGYYKGTGVNRVKLTPGIE